MDIDEAFGIDIGFHFDPSLCLRDRDRKKRPVRPASLDGKIPVRYMRIGIFDGASRPGTSQRRYGSIFSREVRNRDVNWAAIRATMRLSS